MTTRMLCVAAVTSVGLFAASSFAGVIGPDVDVSWSWNDGTMQWDPEGQGGDGVYHYGGSEEHASFQVGWNLTVNTDPYVTGNLVVTNTSMTTQTFIFNAVLNGIGPVGPQSLIGGSAGVTATADGDGGFLSTSGMDAAWTAFIDGTAVATLHDNLNLNLDPFNSDTASEEFGEPIPSQVAPAVVDSIAIQIQFDLSPGESAAWTSVFVVEPIPGPAGLAIFGVALLGVRRRRRA